MEKFKNIASIFQSVIITLAVIIGGGWTLYTFVKLGQLQKAKYDLNGRPSLNIHIETIKTAPLNKSEYCGLIINVDIENKGTSYITLDIKGGSVIVSKIAYVTNTMMRSSENLLLQAVMHYKDGLETNDLDFANIQPNSKKTISYYCNLKTKGLYFISFSSESSDAYHTEMSDPIGLKDSTLFYTLEFTNGVYHKVNHGAWYTGKYIEL